MKQNEKIVPIVLAAGSSERLGTPKALAKFGEKTALRIAIDNCRGYDQPIVVLGSDAEQILPYVSTGTKVVINSTWRDGQLSSLLRALYLVPRLAAMLVYPVDHPLLERRDVTQLVSEYRHRAPSESIVMPHHNKKYGHPIILSGDLRDELAAAGTTRDVVYRVPERLRTFEATTDAIYHDFQTEATYWSCLEEFLKRKTTRKRGAGGQTKRTAW